MNITQLIADLKILRKKYGDLQVAVGNDEFGCCCAITGPISKQHNRLTGALPGSMARDDDTLGDLFVVID